MSVSRTFEAIVLKSYDVGEADRFLVLLTRELGRITARAPGVRRLKSRMGGSMLPFQHLTLTCREQGNQRTVTGTLARTARSHHRPMKAFFLEMQMSELLLSLLHDEDTQPEIFDLTLAFLSLPERANQHILSFSLRLLHLLGVLPEITNSCFSSLTPTECSFVTRSLRQEWPQCETAPNNLHALCAAFVAAHAQRPLHAAEVSLACQQ